MTFAIKQTSDASLVILTVDLPIERYPDQLHWLVAKINHMATTQDSPIYCILDLRDRDITYSDIMLWLHERQTKYAAVFSGTRVRVVMAGEQEMLGVAANHIRKRLGFDVPWFRTVDDALHYAQSELTMARSIP